MTNTDNTINSDTPRVGMPVFDAAANDLYLVADEPSLIDEDTLREILTAGAKRIDELNLKLSLHEVKDMNHTECNMNAMQVNCERFQEVYNQLTKYEQLLDECIEPIKALIATNYSLIDPLNIGYCEEETLSKKIDYLENLSQRLEARKG